jgi:DNA-binding CsgD family transcriptional regulator
MLADALAATASRRAGDVLRLALWQLELGDSDDPDLLLDAARQAYVALDERRAASLAAAAWEAERTVAAGHLLGHLRCDLAEHEAAEAVLAQAGALELDDRHRVLVGMARSENLFRMDRYDDAIAVITAAEERVVDPDWRAELVGHRATLVMLNGRAGEAQEIVAPLLDSPSVRTFVEAAIAGAVTAAYGGHPLTGLELARKAFAAHLGVWEHELFQSDPSVHVFSELLALTQAGLLEEAEQLAAAMHGMAVESQRGPAIAAMALQRGLVASERGQPRTAAKWFGRALPLYDRDGPAQRRRFPLAGLVHAWATLGDVSAARVAERSLLAIDDSVLRFTRPTELCARALLAAADKRPADALALLDDAIGIAESSGERTGLALAVHTYARLGYPERAVDRAAALRLDVEGELLAARCDHVVAADAHDPAALADVAARFAACGARLYGAEAYADASRAAQRASAARDARMLAGKSRELAAQCESAATPALVLTEDAAPLSKREREVAMLAAEGLTAKDIGERLFLSRRTVENHLHRAYDKLGTTGRAGLRAALGLDA